MFAITLLLAVCWGGAAAQRGGGAPSSSNPIGSIRWGGTGSGSREAAHRTITGTVTDKSGHHVPGALVYLRDTNHSYVRTVIADAQGVYQFSPLSLSDDFELWAQNGSLKSAVKPISSYNATPSLTIPLHFDEDAPAATVSAAGTPATVQSGTAVKAK